MVAFGRVRGGTMRAMSLMHAVRYIRSPIASIPQVVLATLVTLWSIFTAQYAALTAYDAAFGPSGITRRPLGELLDPDLSWSQVWNNYSPLLWSVYAAGLLLLLAWMWHIVLTKPPRAGWKYLPLVLAVCTVFWALNMDRYLVA
jgi:hypothetical protein